ISAISMAVGIIPNFKQKSIRKLATGGLVNWCSVEKLTQCCPYGRIAVLACDMLIHQHEYHNEISKDVGGCSVPHCTRYSA
ncbi:MAG: hypothetical protein ACYS83_10185, partial [Planctomycetota bacterium]